MVNKDKKVDYYNIDIEYGNFRRERASFWRILVRPYLTVPLLSNKGSYCRNCLLRYLFRYQSRMIILIEIWAPGDLARIAVSRFQTPSTSGGPGS